MIDETSSTNNQEKEPEFPAKKPEISTAEPGAEPQQSGSPAKGSPANQGKGEESGLTTSNLNHKKSSNRPEKGLSDVNPPMPPPPRGSAEGGQENSNKVDKEKLLNQSSTEEEKNTDKYKYIPDRTLETRRDLNEKKIASFKKDYDRLFKEKEILQQEINETHSLSEQYPKKTKIKRLNEESETIEQRLYQLQTDTEEIENELRKRNATESKTKKNEQENNKSESAKEGEIVSAKTLFKEDRDIENLVFYVATLFPGLNVQDFKRIVGLLLQGRTQYIPLTSNKSIVINDRRLGNLANSQLTGAGNIGAGETKELVKIWQESFDKPDQYLKKCHLKVERQNGKQVINFSSTELRENFLAYFENEQIFYFERQLQRTQEIDLLLDNSQEVADSAINVAVRAAVYYPNDYAEDWLIKLLIKIANEDERKHDNLLKRLSILIHRLQIESEYSHCETIAKKFLERLISPKERKLAFLIIRYLITLNLRTGLLGMQSARSILNWLRELLDSELDDNDIKSDISNLLEELLWESGFYEYIYELLEILKEWLPEDKILPAQYSLSNQAALWLLFAYCVETTLQLELKWYGKGYYVYPMFAPLKGSPDSNVNLSGEFDTLVSWLLYPSPNEKLAIPCVLNQPEVNDNEYLKIIGFLIAEWFVIIWGFKDEEPEKEALNLFENLLRMIIYKASPSQQRHISERWTELTEEYLDKSIQYEESDNKELKRQFVFRRKLLRELKKRFKSLQQKNLENKKGV